MMSLGKTFCKWNTHMDNTCYDVVFAIGGKRFDSKCFSRLELRNAITQVGQNLHFTVFTPLQIWIEHFQFEYSTILFHSTKVIAPIEANISTDFFNFNPKNLSTYQIFYESKPVFNNLFQHMNGKDQLKFFELLIITLSIIALMLLTKELGQRFLLFIAFRDEIIQNHMEHQPKKQTAV